MHSEPWLLLLGLVEAGVDLLVLGVIVVVLALNADSMKLHWRRGLVVGALLLLLLIPQHITTIVFIEPSELFGGNPMMDDPGMERVMRGATLFGVTVGALVGTVIRVVWYSAITCVAVQEWSRLRPDGPLLGQRWGQRAGGLLVALAIGLAAGVLSSVLFHLLDIDTGKAIELLQAYFPGLAEAGPGLRALVATPLGLYAAVAEEIAFRGVLLGFLLRLGRERPWVVLVAAVTTSMAWALLHLSLTDAPGIKLVQIFLIGLGLVWITRRWGLEAAILAHMGLNVAGLLGMLVLG